MNISINIDHKLVLKPIRIIPKIKMHHSILVMLHHQMLINDINEPKQNLNECTNDTIKKSTNSTSIVCLFVCLFYFFLTLLLLTTYSNNSLHIRRTIWFEYIVIEKFVILSFRLFQIELNISYVRWSQTSWFKLIFIWP